MVKERAKEAFEMMVNRKINCAQTTLIAFSGELGLDVKNALNITQAFGGGMRMGSVCGAVTGAYMALGLAHPASGENPRESTDKTSALAAEFNRKFRELHGSLSCAELLGYNLTKPEESATAREKGVFNTVCPALVRDSVQIVENLLNL
jgi:C_GCAxxG_C_C family probable redox protein